jgi:hypothetical protein
VFNHQEHDFGSFRKVTRGIYTDWLYLNIGKRLREATKKQEELAQALDSHILTTGIQDDMSSSNAISKYDAFDNFNIFPCSTDVSVQSSSSQNISLYSPQIEQVPTICRELCSTPTVLAALYFNGEILGLSCTSSPLGRSPPATIDTPLPLQPTPNQLMMVHYTSFDRFPFPRMRDNTISLISIIDTEDFIRDLFTMPTFTIRSGGASWDPSAWEMDKSFAEKWGFLFY